MIQMKVFAIFSYTNSDSCPLKFPEVMNDHIVGTRNGTAFSIALKRTHVTAGSPWVFQKFSRLDRCPEASRVQEIQK